MEGTSDSDLPCRERTMRRTARAVIAELPVTVCHIAHGGYGVEPLSRFLSSYLRHPADQDHTLVVAFKNFQSNGGRARALCRDVGAAVLEVPDGGYDIGTYLHLASQFEPNLLCLLNSNAELLADAWLRKLVLAWREQGGGATAATGSWESLASDELRSAVPATSNPLFPPLRRLWRMARRLSAFPRFPNAHLRTNGLCIAAKDLLDLRAAPPTTKDDAWRFESGRRGLSATLARRGRKLSIIGRDGYSYPVSEWAQSGIFWQGDQQNLLIGDNQTRRYQDGDATLRRALQRDAWQAPRLFGAP